MPLFSLGTIEITPAVSTALATVNVEPATYLTRHQQADWGEVDEATQQDNDFALPSVRSIFLLLRHQTDIYQKH